MKCIVCGKEHSSHACPICSFPVIVVPGGGNIDEVLEANKDVIQHYRDNLLDSISISIIIYRWKEQDGEIVLDCNENIPFGTGKELYMNTVWLDTKFARIPNEETIKLRVLISTSDEDKREVEIELPSLTEPELQELGASLTDSFELKLFLRNSAQTVQSQETAVFI